jgi:hypothetical protein
VHSGGSACAAGTKVARAAALAAAAAVSHVVLQACLQRLPQQRGIDLHPEHGCQRCWATPHQQPVCVRRCKVCLMATNSMVARNEAKRWGARSSTCVCVARPPPPARLCTHLYLSPGVRQCLRHSRANSWLVRGTCGVRSCSGVLDAAALLVVACCWLVWRPASAGGATAAAAAVCEASPASRLRGSSCHAGCRAPAGSMVTAHAGSAGASHHQQAHEALLATSTDAATAGRMMALTAVCLAAWGLQGLEVGH